MDSLLFLCICCVIGDVYNGLFEFLFVCMCAGIKHLMVVLVGLVG